MDREGYAMEWVKRMPAYRDKVVSLNDPSLKRILKSGASDLIVADLIGRVPLDMKRNSSLVFVYRGEDTEVGEWAEPDVAILNCSATGEDLATLLLE